MYVFWRSLDVWLTKSKFSLQKKITSPKHPKDVFYESFKKWVFQGLGQMDRRHAGAKPSIVPDFLTIFVSWSLPPVLAGPDLISFLFKFFLKSCNCVPRKVMILYRSWPALANLYRFLLTWTWSWFHSRLYQVPPLKYHSTTNLSPFFKEYLRLSSQKLHEVSVPTTWLRWQKIRNRQKNRDKQKNWIRDMQKNRSRDRQKDRNRDRQKNRNQDRQKNRDNRQKNRNQDKQKIETGRKIETWI